MNLDHIVKSCYKVRAKMATIFIVTALILCISKLTNFGLISKIKNGQFNKVIFK